MKRKRAIPLMLAIGLGLSTTVQAAYVGASFLRTDTEIGVSTDRFEPDDEGWKIYAGNSWFKVFSVEASYRDLGQHAGTSLVNEVDVDIEAYDICARGILPVAPFFSVFARLGYAYISTDGTVRQVNNTTSVDEEEGSLLYGVGVEFKIARLFGLRAEWEDYDVDIPIGSSSSLSSMSAFSAGAFLRF